MITICTCKKYNEGNLLICMDTISFVNGEYVKIMNNLPSYGLWAESLGRTHYSTTPKKLGNKKTRSSSYLRGEVPSGLY